MYYIGNQANMTFITLWHSIIAVFPPGFEGAKISVEKA
jgi:hypothetical protein